MKCSIYLSFVSRPVGTHIVTTDNHRTAYGVIHITPHGRCLKMEGTARFVHCYCLEKCTGDKNV